MCKLDCFVLKKSNMFSSFYSLLVEHYIGPGVDSQIANIQKQIFILNALQVAKQIQ